MTRQAWFCPSCQKYHAPHVDTCAGTGEGTEAAPWKTFTPLVNPTIPQTLYQDTTGKPPSFHWYPNTAAAPRGADPFANISGIATTRAQ